MRTTKNDDEKLHKYIYRHYKLAAELDVQMSDELCDVLKAGMDMHKKKYLVMYCFDKLVKIYTAKFLSSTFQTKFRPIFSMEQNLLYYIIK